MIIAETEMMAKKTTMHESKEFFLHSTTVLEMPVLEAQQSPAVIWMKLLNTAKTLRISLQHVQ